MSVFSHSAHFALSNYESVSSLGLHSFLNRHCIEYHSTYERDSCASIIQKPDKGTDIVFIEGQMNYLLA